MANTKKQTTPQQQLKQLIELIDVEEMYSEGDWTYIRVLVDGEQAGFASLNPRLKRVGISLHHPSTYPNDRVLEALAAMHGYRIAGS